MSPLATAARGVFVAATDTGVGKTVLAAALCAALAARGVRVAAFKPALTGLSEPEPCVPADHELLASITGQQPQQIAPTRFGPAVSPHFAAQLAGEVIDVPAAVASAHALASHDGFDAVVVEGVGGLLVPLAPGWDIRRFAVELGYPVVLAARPGLGTINHTLLSLEAARAFGLDVRAVVLTPWSAHRASSIERSNRETIAELGGGVPVCVLPRAAALEPAALAAAAGELPIEQWLSVGSVPGDG
ncbi:MAG: dethiobiotin synthase [Solirubrobacteraceae bacterium]